jgi:DNA (cytosine-5)-methyltransferase 1
MGLPEGWVTDVPGLSRNAQLKALGNGVVPAQAALALRMLLERAEAAPLVTARGAA